MAEENESSPKRGLQKYRKQGKYFHIFFLFQRESFKRETLLLKVFSGSNALPQEKMLYFTLEIPDVQIVGIWELEHYILVIPEI